MQKASYKVFGKNRHSCVKLCHWTKCAIKLGTRFCYKQKWYGIKSHQCIQMTPALTVCNLRCMHCWRDHQYFRKKWTSEIDPADEVAQGAIKAQLELLTGLGGVEHNKKLYQEAQNPSQVAISLDGEPMLYPYISQLIEEFRSRKMSTFLVTNGLLTEKIKNLNPLPTQLYISLTSNSKEMFTRTQHPLPLSNGQSPAGKAGGSALGWEDLLTTLESLPDLKTKKVIRITLIKGVNMNHPEKYAELIERSQADFVEIKSYMHIGASQQRLPFEAMNSHDEVLSFAKQISQHCNYKSFSSKPDSRVVLMTKSALPIIG